MSDNSSSSSNSSNSSSTSSSESARKAMAGLGGLVRGVGRDVVSGVGRDVVTGVGRDVGGLIRREFETARAELLKSAKRAGRGAGLLGGAAVAGELSLVFLSLAAWEGLGKRIGPGRAALLLGTLAGGAGVALASRGAEELQRVKGAPRTVQSLKDLGNAAADAAAEPPTPPVA
jgi:hypothetical protein